jgi:hypothetical protein
MGKFREFYVPAGAGSNFLASKCLWANDIENARFTNNTKGHSTSSNEFFFPRVKIGKELKNKELIDMMICDDENLLSETIRIKPILIELDEVALSLSPENHLNSILAPDLALRMTNNRQEIISKIDIIWKDDWTMAYHSFWDWTTWGELSGNKIEVPNSVLNKIHQAQKYFVQCREYYYSVCDRNNWNVEKISHHHPYDEIPGIKLPENFESLAMYLDEQTTEFVRIIFEIKRGNGRSERFRKFYTEYLISNKTLPDRTVRKLPSIGYAPHTVDDEAKILASISNDVDYRKIFFENDEDEIRKMYDFFDNEEHFDKNKMSIMKEFKEYHQRNMELIK